MPSNFIYLSIYLILCQRKYSMPRSIIVHLSNPLCLLVYTNSMLASLNARSGLRDKVNAARGHMFQPELSGHDSETMVSFIKLGTIRTSSK